MCCIASTALTGSVPCTPEFMAMPGANDKPCIICLHESAVETCCLARRTPDESCVGRPGRPVEPRVHRGEPVPWTQPGPGLPPVVRRAGIGPIIVGGQPDGRGCTPCAFVAWLLPAPWRCQPAGGVFGGPRARWRQLQHPEGDGDSEGPADLHLQRLVPVRRGRVRAPGADARGGRPGKLAH